MIKFSRGTSHIVSPHQSLPSNARAKQALSENSETVRVNERGEYKSKVSNIKHTQNTHKDEAIMRQGK